jgi:hypothetical protein
MRKRELRAMGAREETVMGNDGRTDDGMAQAAADVARRATGRGLAEDASPAPVCLGVSAAAGGVAAGIGEWGFGIGGER